MHYGIGTQDGKVHHIECNPLTLEHEMAKLGGVVIITEAETLQLYEKRRTQDVTGKIDSY
jgi:hypothetical protein